MKTKAITIAALLASAAFLQAAAAERIAIIGDSITEIGQDPKNAWGYCNRLKSAAGEGECVFLPSGFGGYMVKTWQEKAAKDFVKGKAENGFDTVVVFLGMNDILRPSVTDDPATWDAWAKDVRDFTALLKERTGAKKFVYATITPLTTDPLSPKNVVREELNERLRAIAAEEGAAIAETGARAMKVVDGCRKLDPYAQPIPDFVHPGSLVHAAIAAEIAKALGKEALSEKLEKSYEGEFGAWAKKNAKKVSWRLKTHPETHKMRGPVIYEIELYPNGATNLVVKAPKDFRVIGKAMDSLSSGILRISGSPEAKVTPVEMNFIFPDGSSYSDIVPIPAPWRVSTSFNAPDLWLGQGYIIKEDPHLCTDLVISGGRWLNGPFMVGDTSVKWEIYTATCDYSGKMNAAAVDPYQIVFGLGYDSLYAVRWVKCPDEREISVRLSHETFSATLALNVWLNNRFHGTHLLDRDGCNRREFKSALKKGWNLLVVRVDHANWQRQFAVDLLSPEGKEMDDLKYSAFPRSTGNNLVRSWK